MSEPCAIQPIPGGRSALVLSPFASHPADAGHRRRVLQTTRLLRDAGYRVTFVLYAFEGAWYWRFDEDAFAAMQQEWGDVQVIMAHRKVGQPPANLATHSLDEWWDTGLEDYLKRTFATRRFDVFVVHNVWLSKAFDLAPPSTLKFLETHDVFWKRGELYRSIGMPMDFFTPTKRDEYIGFDRADVVIAVTEEELDEIRADSSAAAMCIPTFEPVGRQRALERPKYLHEDKVVFGMLGSAHVFNVSGLQRLLSTLELHVAKTFAPVEIVIGGDVGQEVTTELAIKRLGYVENEEDFFGQVDFVLAPLFNGTGFKVKVADAVIYGKPTLAASHAAIGTDLDVACCDETPEAMAERLVQIALERPPLAEYARYAREAARKMSDRTDAGHRLLVNLVEQARTVVIIDLSHLDPHVDFVTIYGYASIINPLSRFARVLIAPPAQFKGDFKKFRHHSVEIVAPDDVSDLYERLPLALLIVPRVANIDIASDILVDTRWDGPPTRAQADLKHIQKYLNFPMVHPFHQWEGLSVALRRRVTREMEKQPSFSQVVFLEGAVGADPQGRTLWVDVTDPIAFAHGVKHVLRSGGRVLEVIWSASADDERSSFFAEYCTTSDIKYHGPYSGGQAAKGKMSCSWEAASYSFDISLHALTGQ